MSLLILSSLFGVVMTILPHSYHRFILKLKKAPVIPANIKPIYNDHMISSKWRKISRERLEKDLYMCQNCSWWRQLLSLFFKVKLEVHHKTYANFGNEKLTDLITLCKGCHTEIHKRK